MRVLVIGGGAREHALVARLTAERDVSEIISVPGNPGTAALARIVPAALDDPDALMRVADRAQVELTVVGPEGPLSCGVADRFHRDGRLVVGPTKAAARLESSKAFAKSFMMRHGVPTARFRTCQSIQEAERTIRREEFGFPVVLKADGLAAGKGVAIAANAEEALAAAHAAMTERLFGDAGMCLVIEECLVGPEVSFFVLVDGVRAVPIGTAQDHKRVFDRDRGPNTGGMGAFAPSPLVDDVLADAIMRDIVTPVVHGMAEEGCPFCGFLYVGLMLTPDGPKVIEFNVRLGDPEAQVLLPLLDGPLLPSLIAAASGRLESASPHVSRDKTVGVVAASRGYPQSSQSGCLIEGISDAEQLEGVSVYHAGTARRDGQLVTAGGRVLTVVGRGRDFREAIGRAYQGIGKINFDGMHYRRDIGQKALAPSNGPTGR